MHLRSFILLCTLLFIIFIFLIPLAFKRKICEFISGEEISEAIKKSGSSLTVSDSKDDETITLTVDIPDKAGSLKESKTTQPPSQNLVVVHQTPKPTTTTTTTTPKPTTTTTTTTTTTKCPEYKEVKFSTGAKSSKCGSQESCIKKFGTDYRLASPDEVKYASEKCNLNTFAYGKMSNNKYSVPSWRTTKPNHWWNITGGNQGQFCIKQKNPSPRLLPNKSNYYGCSTSASPGFCKNCKPEYSSAYCGSGGCSCVCN